MPTKTTNADRKRRQWQKLREAGGKQIVAHIDAETVQALDRLKTLSGETTSQIVMRAIKNL